jgi:hypothetical protein
MSSLTLSQRYPGQMLPVKVIRLTQGQVAIVDPEDYEELSQYRWSAVKSRHVWYAQRSWRRPPRSSTQMHRQLAGYAETDHRNRNGLDNRRVNLREATKAQNAMNRRTRSDNTSGYRGVHWHLGKWQARITLSGKRMSLGHFSDLQEAVAVRQEAAREIFGEFTSAEEQG